MTASYKKSQRSSVGFLYEAACYPHIVFDAQTGLRALVDEMYARRQLTPPIAYETEEDQVVAGLVAQGFGIAIVPYMELLLKLDVEILQISAPVFRCALYLVHKPQMYVSPVVQQFRDFVLAAAADDEGP